MTRRAGSAKPKSLDRECGHDAWWQRKCKTTLRTALGSLGAALVFFKINVQPSESRLED